MTVKECMEATDQSGKEEISLPVVNEVAITYRIEKDAKRENNIIFNRVNGGMTEMKLNGGLLAENWKGDS